MASMMPVVRVGVGAVITCAKHPNCVLIGKRLGSHGQGRYALPGGHLELGETWAECAVRETKEETNLDVVSLGLNRVQNDIAIDGNADKHYITIFMNVILREDSEKLQNIEPDKCEGWEWVNFEELKHFPKTILFDPLSRFIDEGGTFFPSRD